MTTSVRACLALLVAGLAATGARAAGKDSGAMTPRFFVTEAFPPYTFMQAGRAAGPMVDVLQEVCIQLGWSCRIEVLPWRRALAMAERGQADGLFTLLDTPERRELFRASSPVLDGRYTLFARAGQAFSYTGAASLTGRQVGVYGPSGSSISLRALIDTLPSADAAQLVLEPDNLTVLRKLVSGRYGEDGLAFMNESVALWLLRENGLNGLQAAGVAKQFSYSFGLSRQRINEREFRRFNKALDELCRRGRTAELIRPYALPASPCAK
ncbi:substrate-binding periplasmic protein [Kinneretia aquatilis]|uniref:substrate-binding periplasmic protein n=1 Tax=Kinneretia aquatilis TaxID=2070761 RepID=UPI0014952D3B|nr:transporter substrate-binding domain-containing protein [Paucibacter aquatile]WIV98150.1 transporter substrate-binding domain-containing protein [Paucibacter aquatile]